MNYMEEDKAVRNFIIIFVIVILFVVGLYFFTKNVINKDSESKSDDTETKEVTIDNSVAIVGTMLQKKEDNYYVILYKSDDKKASIYSSLVSKYKTLMGDLVVYTVDLSNTLNTKYYDNDNINLTADNINDLRFGDLTLLEIKKGKIVKSYTSIDEIKKLWKIS